MRSKKKTIELIHKETPHVPLRQNAEEKKREKEL